MSFSPSDEIGHVPPFNPGRKEIFARPKVKGERNLDMCNRFVPNSLMIVLYDVLNYLRRQLFIGVCAPGPPINAWLFPGLDSSSLLCLSNN